MIRDDDAGRSFARDTLLGPLVRAALRVVVGSEDQDAVPEARERVRREAAQESVRWTEGRGGGHGAVSRRLGGAEERREGSCERGRRGASAHGECEAGV